jgi:branched-chain amino acid transport system ATP-binding protein
VILEAVNLRKQFGALVAVDDVSIQVQRGSLHAIIGPNGAGKTTLFNLLSGNLKPTSGRVLFKGATSPAQPVHRTIHFGIGRSFQITNIFPSLTVFENIRLACAGAGQDNLKFWRSASHFKRYEERTWAVIEQVGLRERAHTAARTLPHGDQRKLELGVILAPDPEVLMLDEPTAGMASEQVPELIALIQQHPAERRQDDHAGGAQHERGDERVGHDHGHAPGQGARRRAARGHRRQQGSADGVSGRAVRVEFLELRGARGAVARQSR